MRGQVSLETLIVLAAFAGAFLLLLGNYNEIFDVSMAGMDKKKVEYAASLLQDIADNCEGMNVRVNLPFAVELRCDGGKAVAKVGEHKEEVPGLKCTSSGEGKRIAVENCMVKII